VSAYDTIDRDPRWWVRVYCEVPMADPEHAIYLSVGDREPRRVPGDCDFIVEYMSPDDAIRLATALLNAAAKAKHQLKVDTVLEGTR
jgi:hypothetical protein